MESKIATRKKKKTLKKKSYPENKSALNIIFRCILFTLLTFLWQDLVYFFFSSHIICLACRSKQKFKTGGCFDKLTTILDKLNLQKQESLFLPHPHSMLVSSPVTCHYNSTLIGVWGNQHTTSERRCNNVISGYDIVTTSF